MRGHEHMHKIGACNALLKLRLGYISRNIKGIVSQYKSYF